MINQAILITGGAGFIGSNFILGFLSRNQDKVLINLDALTYSGNLANLKTVENNSNYIFVKGSINDQALVADIFNGKYSRGLKVTEVVHFAAESHVDRSIQNSAPFVVTNVLGTQVLLDVANQAWKNDYSGKRFLHVSTDEVYGSLGAEGLFTETSQIKPNSPYSASKASSDLLARAYYKTHNFPALITRCSNNYGPYQFPEKLIPLIIMNILKGQDLPVYGKGENIRDWLYVADHCEAIEAVLGKGKIGEVYNIGGNNEMKNIDIVRLLCDIVDEELGRDKQSQKLIKFVKDRPGHDLRYAIDAFKIKAECGWQPRYSFATGIKETVRWYLNNQAWLGEVASGNYLSYYEGMYSNKW